MKVCNAIMAAMMSSLCASCTQTNPIQTPNFLISQTAAQKALGGSARQTNLLPPNSLVAGKIFHIKPTGEIYQICGRDFDPKNGQLALTKMNTFTTRYPSKVVEDTLRGSASISLIVGVSANSPYRKIKVTGYNTYTASTEDNDGDVAKYIIGNLGKKCRTKILGRNRPYYVVTSVAEAAKVEISERPFISGSGKLGLLDFEIEKQNSTTQESDVIFGFIGEKSQ